MDIALLVTILAPCLPFLMGILLLPPDIADFTGRTDYIQEIEAVLQQGALFNAPYR